MKNFLFVLIVVPVLSLAQNHNFTFKASLYNSSFRLSDLKTFQKELTTAAQNSFRVPIKNTSSFPDDYTYEVQMGMSFTSHVNAGLVIQYTSSGARSAYSDYSGKFQVDYVTEAKYYGVYTEYKLLHNEHHNILIGSKFLLIFSDLNFSTILTVWEESVQDKFEFNSNSFGVSPYLAYEFSYGFFVAQLAVNYLNDFGGQLKGSDSDFKYIIRRDQSKAESNWSGIRIGLSLGFCFL
ncbi:MAG: hypothetical protein KDF60_14770 [Calditrichaeota bacterium]|nr:hypothetical protein [Calditrichota bacterium]